MHRRLFLLGACAWSAVMRPAFAAPLRKKPKQLPVALLDAFVGPYLETMLTDTSMRKQFLAYCKQKLGSNYGSFIYDCVIDEYPELQQHPLMNKILRRKLGLSMSSRRGRILRR